MQWQQTVSTSTMVKNMRLKKLIKTITSKCLIGTCLLFLLFLNNGILANKKIHQHELSRDWMYKKSNVYIVAHPAFSPQPKITSFINPYNHEVKLKGLMNFNFGFVYMYNFTKNYGISVGLHIALMSFKQLKYNYTLADSFYTKLNLYKDYCFKCNVIVNHASTFPIRFIYRKQVAEKIDINLQAGFDIQLQRSFLYEYYDARAEIGKDTSSFTTFSLFLENKGNKKFTVVPYFGFSVGINQLLKNNHYINYQFSGHIPFINPYTNGKFAILPNTPYEASGTFKLNPMSFGLEVNYVFTFNRRKLRKERNKSEIRYFDNNKQKVTLP